MKLLNVNSMREVNEKLELHFNKIVKEVETVSITNALGRYLAEDIVSDIFFQFYANKTFLEIKSSYRLYLFKTVRNRAFNYLKWDLSRKADLSEASQKPALQEQQPDQISDFEELCKDVEEAVNKLPIERRKIYLMQKFEGKKYQEIANELNLSVKTVDVQITKANQFVRNLLKEKWLILIAVSLINLIL